MPNFFKQFAALFTFLGVTSEPEQNQHGVFVSQDTLTKMDDTRSQLEQVQKDLATATAAKTKADSDLSTVTTAKETAEKDLAAAKTKNTELQEEVDRLNDVVAGKAAEDPKVKRTGQEATDPKADKVDWNVINALPHNKKADQLID